MKQKYGAGLRKTFYSCSTALVGMAVVAALTPAAWAQDAEEEETIVVTGSRISQPEFELSSPVASADAETIQRSGITNITEFVQDMPALLNSFDSYDSADTENGGTQGLNLLNLRNLGTARTLVLVDGRRHVAGNEGSAAVDVNSIPIDLIERVEVLTGGASAVYGADGVTGVVNFIMRDNFEGVSGRLQAGVTEEGGAEDYFASVLAGTNFANGRGNFTAAFEYASATELNSTDRDFSTPGLRETLVEDPYGGPYTFNFFRDVRYMDTSPQGTIWSRAAFDGPGLFGQSWLADGTPWVNGDPAGDFTMIGGSGSLLDQFVDQLLPGLDRYSLNFRAHYDLNNNHRIFGEAKWSRTETLFEGQVTYDFFMNLPVDNPFIPDVIYDDAMSAGGSGDAYGLVFMARDNFDLGPTYHDITRDTYRTVIGLSGDVTSNINYEISAVWGQTQTEQTYHTRNNERWFAAIDVVDNGSGPECRSNDGVSVPIDWQDGGLDFFQTFAPGECVAANIFGNGVMSQEARDWIMVDLVNNITISQAVLNGYLSGDTTGWFELPGGPMSWVAGFEYREEESEYDHSELGEIAEAAEAVIDWPGYDLIWNGRGVDSFGRYDVAELFFEIEAPILRDSPFAEELTVDAAYRASDYSTAGNTDTWKYGVRWRPTNWLMLRGTQAQAVRAPNIGELFLPAQQTFGEIDDPCDDTNVNTGSIYRYDNCLAALTDLGLADPDPNNFNNTTSTSIPGFVSGNENLRPETADTLTYGLVFEPTFLDGLSISVDYWQIELADAIQFFSGQTIVDYCYDLPQPNQYCAFVERTATGIPSLSVPAGGISFFTTTGVNVASFETSGIDIGIRYRLDPANFGIQQDIGRFQFALNATQTEEYVFTESPISPPDDQLGEPNLPEWQAVLDVTWLWGNFTLNYGYSWFSETERFTPGAIADDPNIVDPAYFNYSERSVHDIYAAYDFSDRFQVYGGVNNFTEQLPDRGNFGYPVSPLGRFFYLGARASF